MLDFLLKNNWFSLMQDIGCDREIAQKWWGILKHQYTQKNRFYHNLSHIDYLITLYTDYYRFLKLPHLVLLSIWFHDAIYQATEKNNEEKSNDFFLDFAKESHLDNEDTHRISNFILATKTHLVDSSLQDENDLLFFLDFDLAILGASAEEYKNYVQQIRLEYKHLTLKKFCLERIEVLKSLLAMQLYKTEVLREKYLKSARYNLLNELRELNNQINMF
ncbi:HD domain-containing protein [Legionella hackeliae]|uniref:Putative Predicted HD phosphohydrolase family protein n=1 Tax=Legionella hackeliae TaxID=449 RepID=A0A0A8UQU5_LEGHA|nr:hypothetical protein [Legionella hackeliae]KTD10407.1 hypothetical protein Lhac_2775 [Legionella hackeliae]CEK09906.1 putative Predicted HD phosphohydrolase family protein [Legionella hackeliae]STX49818.1 Uncharacterized protein conserved in bacteria [Legionella hackeliae]